MIAIVIIKMLSNVGGDSVIRKRFAALHGDDNFTFVYEPGVGTLDIYPSMCTH